MRIVHNHLNKGFLLYDIIHELSSTVDKLREVKSYNFKNEIKNIKGIEGMVEFIDTKSFENNFQDTIERERLLIKIDDIDYKFREIFYSTTII